MMMIAVSGWSARVCMTRCRPLKDRRRTSEIEQIERADGQQPFRGVVSRRACHVMSGIPQEFDDAGQRVLVVIEDEDSIG